MSQPHYWHLDALDWEDPQRVRSEVRALARTGAAAGARRAPLSRGENGFFAALNEMPPGFVVPPHRHSDAELFVVLSGSCTVADGTRLLAGDVASIPARMEYGFEVGPEGLRFVVVRASDASTTLSD
jgi:quercetin dioxygenase-like cupin family protein